MTQNVKDFVVLDCNENLIILDIPINDFDITNLDSNRMEDEPFIGLEMIPAKVGVYELECRLQRKEYEDFEFEIKRVKPLYQVE